MDVGPVLLVYNALCAVPGAAAGFLAGRRSRLGAGATLATTVIGGIGGGILVGTMPAQPPGRGNDALLLGALILFTAACGWLLAFVAARLLRRSAG